MFGPAANNHGRWLPVIHHWLLWGNRWGEGKLSSWPGIESEDGIASRICLCCVAGTSLAPFDFRGKPKIFWLSPYTTKQRPSCLLRLSDEDIFQKIKQEMFKFWGQNLLWNQYKHPTQGRRPAAVMQAWRTGPWLIRETALAQPGRLSMC